MITEKRLPYNSIFLVVLFIVVLMPVAAQACSVCGGGYTQKQQDAYLFITILLASMPLIMGGGLVFWFYRKFRNQTE